MLTVSLKKGLNLLIWTVSLVLLASCAPMWVETGADPVKVEVGVEAKVTQAKVEHTLEINQLTPPFTGGGLLHEIKGPFWQWGLYLVRSAEDLAPLKPEDPSALESGPGLDLKRRLVFNAPKGKLRLRLLVECYMEHHYIGDLPGGNVDPVPVITWFKDYDLDLSPGQEIQITASFK
ncbi:hypothetical protein [Dethiosulfatarculus sandiegensis]|uniref:Lipoprotein n=1 Tax=Dethiosulfatarculus sandiegensis TaxID=1429043 RepID=A0A0D2GLF1_9BACT|nr:hypothetical protein [Dethiosulfatarculus sandiegensis]KIX15487.1 hypothetical protein X474_04475 [Dethiosulfatarculus sandiegensis]